MQILVIGNAEAVPWLLWIIVGANFYPSPYMRAPNCEMVSPQTPSIPGRVELLESRRPLNCKFESVMDDFVFRWSKQLNDAVRTFIGEHNMFDLGC